MASLPYRVPALYWPRPTARHPQSEELIRRVDEELTTDGILTESRYRTAFDTLGLGELVSQCHPVGDLEGAVEAAVIAAWAFLADNPQGDQWMPTVLIPDADSLHGDVLLTRALDPEVHARITHPLERSVANSLRKLAAYTSHEKVSLYAATMIEWFVSEFEDMRLRAKDTPPSVEEAVRLRCVTHAGPVVEAYTAAVFPRLTLEEAAAPEVRAIWQLQALAWSLHNDLYSGYVDFGANSTVMRAYMHEHHTGPQEAADFLGRLADRAAHEGIQRAAELTKTAPPWVTDYASTAGAYTAAGLNWYPSVIHTRYQAPGMDMNEVEYRRSPEPAATGRPGIPSIDHLWT
jgi:hypothetical protein